MEIDISQENK